MPELCALRVRSNHAPVARVSTWLLGHDQGNSHRDCFPGRCQRHLDPIHRSTERISTYVADSCTRGPAFLSRVAHAPGLCQAFARADRASISQGHVADKLGLRSGWCRSHGHWLGNPRNSRRRGKRQAHVVLSVARATHVEVAFAASMQQRAHRLALGANIT